MQKIKFRFKPDHVDSFAKLGELRAVFLDLTNRCNLRCRYCFNYRSLQSPSTDLGFDLIEKALQSGLAKSVTDWFLSGGEPALYPHLPEALKLFRQHGIGPKIATNGTQITPEVLDTWIDDGVRSVQFSLDTLEPGRHADLNGGGGRDLEVILRNLRHAVGSPLRVVVSSVLTQTNKAEIPDIMAFSFESGADSYTLYPNVPSDGQNKELTVPFPELLELTDGLFSAYRSLCPTRVIDLTLPRFGDSRTCARWRDILTLRLHHCAAAQFALKITSAGGVSACICQANEPFLIGDLRRQSLDEIWVAEPAQKFRSLYRQIPECIACSHSSVCRGGCRNNAALFGSNGVYSLDPYCQYMKSCIE